MNPSASLAPPTPAGLDAREFAERVASLRPELGRAARRLTSNPADADDLLQEAVLRAWAFRGGFAPGTNFRAWMHRILRNAGISRYRRRRREREALDQHRTEVEALPPPSWSDDPSRVDQGLSDELTAALRSLRAPFAETVHLVDVEGLSYDQAAARLGCPVGTVMSRLHRARGQLRRRLSDEALPKAA